MQNFVLHKKFYQINGIDESEYSKEAYERYEKLCLYKKLRTHGCSEQIALEAIKMPRSTYYRWVKRYASCGLAGLEVQSKRPHVVRKPQWGKATQALVLKTRKEFPLWGKAKLAVIIKRNHNIVISVSTVGRILKKAVAEHKVKPVMFFYGKLPKRPRSFTGHAKRWRYGMKSSAPGELIQVDHMTINLPGMQLKHFKAVCPFTKVVVEQVYRSATSFIAAEFLELILQTFPFKVVSIQVDGGSEFMGSFEELCQKQALPLYVLPPRRPKYNGTVERGNSTVKYEFYYQYAGPIKLKAIRSSLKMFVEFYNQVRPHQAINYLTPHEFCSQLGIRP